MLAVNSACAWELANHVNLWVTSKSVDEIHQDVLFRYWVNHSFRPNVLYKEAERRFHID